MKYYKGFDEGLECRGMQYKENTVFEMKGEPIICNKGFHFCSNPVDVLRYYPLICMDGYLSEFAEVQLCRDSKVVDDFYMLKHCTNKIEIKNKIPFFDYIDLCFEYLLRNAEYFQPNLDRYMIATYNNNLLRANNHFFMPESNVSINTAEDDCVFVLKGDDQRIKVKGHSNRVILLGDDATIELLHNDIYNTRILSKGEHTRIFIEKNVVAINAELGTEVIYQNEDGDFDMVKVDGINILPNIDYLYCRGYVTKERE